MHPHRETRAADAAHSAKWRDKSDSNAKLRLTERRVLELAGPLLDAILGFRDFISDLSERDPALLPDVRPKDYRWVAFMEHDADVDTDIAYDLHDLLALAAPLRSASVDVHLLTMTGIGHEEFVRTILAPLERVVAIADQYPEMLVDALCHVLTERSQPKRAV